MLSGHDLVSTQDQQATAQLLALYEDALWRILRGSDDGYGLHRVSLVAATALGVLARDIGLRAQSQNVPSPPNPAGGNYPGKNPGTSALVAPVPQEQDWSGHLPEETTSGDVVLTSTVTPATARLLQELRASENSPLLRQLQAWQFRERLIQTLGEVLRLGPVSSADAHAIVHALTEHMRDDGAAPVRDAAIKALGQCGPPGLSGPAAGPAAGAGSEQAKNAILDVFLEPGLNHAIFLQQSAANALISLGAMRISLRKALRTLATVEAVQLHTDALAEDGAHVLEIPGPAMEYSYRAMALKVLVELIAGAKRMLEIVSSEAGGGRVGGAGAGGRPEGTAFLRAIADVLAAQLRVEEVTDLRVSMVVLLGDLLAETFWDEEGADHWLAVLRDRVLTDSDPGVIIDAVEKIVLLEGRNRAVGLLLQRQQTGGDVAPLRLAARDVFWKNDRYRVLWQDVFPAAGLA